MKRAMTCLAFALPLLLALAAPLHAQQTRRLRQNIGGHARAGRQKLGPAELAFLTND
jgi:hypothetical protein